MMQPNIISGLEGQLQSAQYGTGPDGADWYIPPPTASMDRNTLEWTLDKLIDLKQNIQGVVAGATSIFQQSTRTNGLKMIAIFEQRIQEYTVALNKLNQPVPTLPVPIPKPIPIPTTQQPEPDPDPGQTDPPPVEKKNNWLLYGGIAAAAYLLSRKKKKSVQGVSNETIAVVGIAALFLLSRKKETVPPVTTVPAAILPENIIEQSTYLR